MAVRKQPEGIEKEYILFCDESDKRGEYYSNFYGGLLVGASQYQPVTKRLNAVKMTLNLFNEVKWKKVTSEYLGKYKTFIDALFDEVAAGNVKIRIMFRQNAQEPKGLTSEQKATTYWRLYYQFVKHAFGFAQMTPTDEDRNLTMMRARPNVAQGKTPPDLHKSLTRSVRLRSEQGLLIIG